MADLYPRPIEGVASKGLPSPGHHPRGGRDSLRLLLKQEIISARLPGEANASLLRHWYHATTSPAWIRHIYRRETERRLHIRRPKIVMNEQ